MNPTYLFRIIGFLLLLNLSSSSQAKERPGPFALSGGCITSATQYVINGSIPATITATVASGGTCSAFSYQWQRSTDNVYFTDIPGATGQNLGFTASLPPTQATWFQRKTTCGTEVVYTGSVAVNMIAKFFYNVEASRVFTRTCPTGGTPQPYTYIVRDNKYASPFNQPDADAKAQKDLTDSGLYYANLKGVCLWYNVEKRNTLTRNDCGTTGTGSSYIYIVQAKKYSSAISQPDADAKAQKDINDSTQYYANRMGTCTWYNVARDSTTTKKDCPAGTTPTSYKYIVVARKYSSNISQLDADAKANKDIRDSTQLKANANGACQNLFISIRSDGGTDPGYFNISVTNSAGVQVYQRSGLEDMLPLAVALPASPWYTVSVASMGQMYTLVNGGSQKFTNNSSASWSASNIIKVEVSKTQLFYNDYASANYIKQCPEGYAGSTVTYSVPAEKYSSPIGVTEANAKAQKELSDSGQVRANRLGTCTLAQLVSITLTNYFPGSTPPSPHTVSFIKDGVVMKISNFPTTATGSVTITLPAGIYTMTFSSPNSPVGAPLGWNLRPQDYYWSKPGNSTTVTTGTVTFVYGTAYTIMANQDL